jgi:hypothetical protein
MDKKDFFDKYFYDGSEDCPGPALINGLIPNYIFHYVGHTYLNGIVNYTKPVKVFMINRYNNRYNTNIEDIDNLLNTSVRKNYKSSCVKIKDLFPNDKINTDFIINKLNNKEIERCHTDLGMFCDDIILLAEIDKQDINSDEKQYVFFWSDMDCVDCSVGKIVIENKPDAISELVNDFTEFCKLRNDDLYVKYLNNHDSILEQQYQDLIPEPLEILPHVLSGWIKF